MTDVIDLDDIKKKQSLQPVLPFAGGDMNRSGIRLTRAEFSRFLEVSKQAVTDWVKSGKIVIGADGRLDPRQAVSQLLRSGDPARLRSKVLAPLVKDVGALQQRVANLERELAGAMEDATFALDGQQELLDLIDALVIRLRMEWPVLIEIDHDTSLAAISVWIEKARMHGADPDTEIISFIVRGDEPHSAGGALDLTEGGEGKYCASEMPDSMADGEAVEQR